VILGILPRDSFADFPLNYIRRPKVDVKQFGRQKEGAERKAKYLPFVIMAALKLRLKAE
jgi:hypothetical protein